MYTRVSVLIYSGRMALRGKGEDGAAGEQRGGERDNSGRQSTRMEELGPLVRERVGIQTRGRRGDTRM